MTEFIKAQVYPRWITLGGKRLDYDPYYVRIAAEELTISPAAMMQRMLRQWAGAVDSLQQEEQTVFLPFDLYDEWTDCLSARLQDGKVILRCVTVAFAGYNVEPDNLSAFLRESPEVETEQSLVFGEYALSELVTALRSAEVGS